MPSIDQLTDDEFIQLLNEYFAEPVKRHKMSNTEIKDLAKRLNGHINVPIIRETTEEKILIKIVIKVDTYLYDNLPNEFYDLLSSLDNGIDDVEAKRLIKRLSKLANEKVDIPYIPEPMEYVAIRFIIAIIINAARKQWDMKRAKDAAENLIISNQEKPSDGELEALVA